MKNMFYEKLSKEIKRQTLIQESLEKLKKIYFPKIFNLLKDTGLSEESRTMQANEIIDFIFKLDPTHTRTKGEMFAKNLFKIYYNKVKDLIGLNEIARETNLFASTIRKYNKLIEENPPKEIGIPMKSLNDFESIEKIEEYIGTIEKKIEEIETKRRTKGLNKLQPIYQNQDFKAYFIEDEDVMANTFGGISDWCVSKENDYWSQYTSNDGLMIVFQNLMSDIPGEEKYILATLRYDDETLSEINNLKNEESENSMFVSEFGDDVATNLKNKYNVSKISEIGEGLYEHEPKITLDGNKYSQEEIEEVFDKIDTTLIDEGNKVLCSVEEVNVNDKSKTKLFWDFVAEYDIGDSAYMEFDWFEFTANTGEFNELEIPVVPINGKIEHIEVVGESFHFEIKNSSVEIDRVIFNNCDGGLEAGEGGISGMDGGNNRIKNFFIGDYIYMLSIENFKIEKLFIEGGDILDLNIEHCEIEKLIMGWDDNGPREIFNSVLATSISEMDSYGQAVCLMDCGKYNFKEFNEEITINELIGDINNYQEQLFVFDESIEKIEFIAETGDIEKITLSGAGLNDLKELILYDDSFTVELPYEVFLNLENFDGEKELIKFTDKETGSDQELIKWEMFDRLSRFL